jgi:hypothetical protein
MGNKISALFQMKPKFDEDNTKGKTTLVLDTVQFRGDVKNKYRKRAQTLQFAAGIRNNIIRGLKHDIKLLHDELRETRVRCALSTKRVSQLTGELRHREKQWDIMKNNYTHDIVSEDFISSYISENNLRDTPDDPERRIIILFAEYVADSLHQQSQYIVSNHRMADNVTPTCSRECSPPSTITYCDSEPRWSDNKVPLVI